MPWRALARSSVVLRVALAAVLGCMLVGSAGSADAAAGSRSPRSSSGTVAVSSIVAAGTADSGPEQQLALRYAPVVRVRTQEEDCGPGESVPADRCHRAVARQRSGVPRTVVEPRPDQGRADRRGPEGRLVRLPPRLPRGRALPRLRLREVGAQDHWRPPADRLCARHHRCEASGQGGAAVLVLLRLQRLQQQARGRLGDDPARLPGQRRGRRAAHRPHRGRLHPALERGAGGLGRGQAGARRRHAPGRLPAPKARTRTSSRRRCTSATARRPASAATTPPGRTPRSPRRRGRAVPSGRPTCSSSRGWASRGDGESCSRRSTTDPPGRT